MTFDVIPSTIYVQKISSRRLCLLELGMVIKESRFFVTVNISVKTLWRHAIFALAYQIR